LEGNEQNTKNGGELIKLEGVLHHWTHQKASSGSNQLAWASWAASTSPIFAINRGGRLSMKGSTPLVFSFHFKLVRKRRKKEKIQAEALP